MYGSFTVAENIQTTVCWSGGSRKPQGEGVRMRKITETYMTGLRVMKMIAGKLSLMVATIIK